MTTLRQRSAFVYHSLRMRARSLGQRARWSYLSGELRDPVFVIGSPRSGTTLIQALLGHHPDIYVYPGEANHLWHPETYPWRHSRFRDRIPPYWADPELYIERSLELRHRHHVDHLRSVFGAHARMNRGKVFLNKSPLITLMVPYVASAYPKARFINITRDGRSVALSFAKKAARRISENRWLYAAHGFDLPFDQVLARCASSWVCHVRAAERLRADDSPVPEDRLLDVRYEDFCDSPVEELRRICDFLAVASDPIAEPLPVEVASQNWKATRDVEHETTRLLDDLLGGTLTRLGYG